MSQQKFRPATWAKQEALDELEGALNQQAEEIYQLHTHLHVFERAMVSVIEDIEAMSNVLVDAGLIELDPDSAVEDPDDDEDEEKPEKKPEDPTDYGLAPVENVVAEQERQETEAEHATRVEAARARRAAAIQAQGVKEFEDGNEDPRGAMTDPNDIVDIPEEGVVVDAGRDPFTGRPRS